MGQDISILAIASKKDLQVEIDMDCRAHSSVFDYGSYACEWLLNVAEELGLKWGKIHTSRDFEGDCNYWWEGDKVSDQDIAEDDFKTKAVTPEWFGQNPKEGGGDTWNVCFNSDAQYLNVTVVGGKKGEILEVLCKYLLPYINNNSPVGGTDLWWYEGSDLFRYRLSEEDYDTYFIEKPNLYSLTKAERDHYKVNLPIRAIEFPIELIEYLGTRTDVGKIVGGQKAFKNAQCFRKPENLHYLFANGTLASWEEANGEKFLYADPKSKAYEKMCYLVNLGLVDLSDWYLADTNKLYIKKYHEWLKENDLRQLGTDQGIGNKEIKTFFMEV